MNNAINNLSDSCDIIFLLGKIIEVVFMRLS